MRGSAGTSRHSSAVGVPSSLIGRVSRVSSKGVADCDVALASGASNTIPTHPANEAHVAKEGMLAGEP